MLILFAKFTINKYNWFTTSESSAYIIYHYFCIMAIKINELETHGPKSWDKEKKKKQTDEYLEKLYKLQTIFHAQKKYGILVIFQGLDASGKDGVCKSVFGKLNPLTINFMSWKAPNELEKAHDYLWRIHSKLPQKGEIQVFNRSYYEDILVPSVLKTHDKDEIKDRYDQINWFEKYMKENNIKVIKFFFHVSEKVQEERMEERLQDITKMRKHNDSDRETLEMREKYLNVYEDILNKCNDPEWKFVPSDHNWEKNYVVAKELYEEIKKMDLERPTLDTDRTLDEYLENVENLDTIEDFNKLKEKLAKEAKKKKE